MTILTPEQWALVEAEYVSGSNSLAELAERFEVSEHTIMRHSRCANWRLKRQAVRRYLSASMMEIKKAEIPGSGAHILQAAIKTRVSNMVDQLLSSLKLHGGGDSQSSSMDRARDVRTMATLMKLMDRLHGADTPAPKHAHEDWLKYDDDAIYDWLSREIDEAKRMRDESITK